MKAFIDKIFKKRKQDAEKIEKNKAVVNYGVFTSKVNLEQLEFVQAK